MIGIETAQSMPSSPRPLTPDTRKMTSSLRCARPASARMAPISNPIGSRS